MRNTRRPMAVLLTKVVMGAALATSLSGCFGLIVGAGVAGAVSTVDRRTLGAQTEDKSITVKAELEMRKVTNGAGNINVTSFNRRVLLTGEVRDEAMKQAAEREVRAIANVVSVINELQVSGSSSYTSRSNDALITTKVKTSLVDMKTVSAISFKVTTERGVVYLMGLVTPREGNIAADVAKGVSGVTRVVKIFEYISEEDARVRQNSPAQASLD
ncbi:MULTISPECIES: BON domain-containing protein [Massilia]|uniref:Transporter n=1 Tax=Massilia aurea TaxID=373040 RepID=A0A422QPF3_9BURK|nr:MULTISPECIES: BON domain-containing protein [Massilia]MDY0963219.1 BON domain-containing protein [Massilia sp. CFBP9026]RNF31899.1 transporter [Massilia aurea]